MACMISHRHRFAFCHIPRTGGTSLTEYVRKYCTKRSNLGKENDEFVEESHTPLWKMRKNHFRGRDADWWRYFKFAIVRNPYDRMVSLWIHLSQSRKEQAWEGSTFRDFCYNLSSDIRWAEIMRLRYGQAIYWPAKTYLCFYDNPSMADSVIRFETAFGPGGGIEQVLDKFGIKKPTEMPHVNRSDRKPYQEYYDDFCREVVAKRYEWDLKEFGYEF